MASVHVDRARVKVNRFALTFRTTRLKTEEGRRKRIAAFVAMLERGEAIHPNGAKGGPAPRKRSTRAT